MGRGGAPGFLVGRLRGHGRARFGARAGRILAGGLLAIALATPTQAHERPRPGETVVVDPGRSYPFLVISGAGGHFHSLAVLRSASILLAGTHLGLFASRDQGVTWRLQSVKLGSDPVRALAADPRTGRLWAALRGRGLVVSADGGRRWTSVSLPASGEVQALAADPRNPGGLYVWVRPQGLFHWNTTDAAWARVADAGRVPFTPEALALEPRVGGRLYGAAASGVWISEDGGRTWHRPPGGLSDAAAVAVVPWGSGGLLAATRHGAWLGRPDATGWARLPEVPAWWGPLTAFAFADTLPGLVLALSHEGVVAVLPLEAPAQWVPLAQWRAAGAPAVPAAAR